MNDLTRAWLQADDKKYNETLIERFIFYAGASVGVMAIFALAYIAFVVCFMGGAA